MQFEKPFLDNYNYETLRLQYSTFQYDDYYNNDTEQNVKLEEIFTKNFICYI